MSLLDPPRCPNCNSEVDLKELWRAAPKAGSGSVIEGAVGIKCPTCGIKLRVLQAHLQITSALVSLLPLSVVLLFACFNPSYLDKEKRRVVLAIFAVIYPVCFFLMNRSVPKLLRLRALKNGELVVFPLEPVTTSGHKEAPFVPEPLDHESDETQESWVCPKCGEENPGNFDECWRCQTWKTDKTVAPAAATTTK